MFPWSTLLILNQEACLIKTVVNITWDSLRQKKKTLLKTPVFPPHIKSKKKELIRAIIQIQTRHQTPSSASTHQGFHLKKLLQFPFKSLRADTAADQECRHISFPPSQHLAACCPDLKAISIVQTGNTPPTGAGNYQSEKRGWKHHHWAANVQSYCPGWWCTGFPWWKFKGSCPRQALRWSCACRLRSCRWPPLSESSATSARSCPGAGS